MPSDSEARALRLYEIESLPVTSLTLAQSTEAEGRPLVKRTLPREASGQVP